MIIKKLNNNNYIVKIIDEKLIDIDIFNIQEIELFIKKIIIKVIQKYNIIGKIELNIYINNYYGIIIEIETKENNNINNYIDTKIVFHLDAIFLYEIDYFDIIENTNIKNKNIYYYNKKYYLELLSDISKKDYNYLLEASNIYHNSNNQNILNKGIKIGKKI